MDLKSVGEFGLISIIKKKFEDMTSIVVEGIGDDCAVIPKDCDTSYVVTTDMLVEGKHFLLDKISPFELGYKSLAVNISDVASMGAAPKFSFLSLAIPSNVTKEWCEEFIEGYHNLSLQHNVQLLGGDTTAASDGNLTISVTAVGEVLNDEIKRRSAAKIGDIVAVTTELGDSAAALNLMLLGEHLDGEMRRKHTMPRANVDEGIWLGKRGEVRAMMDISDGVASDMEHICTLSKCGADIFCDTIPHSDSLVELCQSRGWDILDLSLAGGEDYGLLLTVESGKFDNLQKDFHARFGTVLHSIGVVTSANGVKYLCENRKEFLLGKGFRHF